MGEKKQPESQACQRLEMDQKVIVKSKVEHLV